MISHAKASFAASTPAGSFGRARIASACLLAALALLGIGASSASAAWGSLDFFGNATSATSNEGGRFGADTTGNGTGIAPTGVAINDPAVADLNGTEGDVYVADRINNRVQQFKADGTFVRAWGTDVVVAGAPNDANEMQAVRVNADDGQFTLSFGVGGAGVSDTIPLDSEATGAEVEAALNALTNISAGGGSVTVSGGPGDAGGTTPYLVNFNGGPLASADIVTSFTGASVGLSGGVGVGADAVTVSTFTGGGASAGTHPYEICDATTSPPNTAAQCKNGTGSGASGIGGNLNLVSGIAVNQETGHVYVTGGSELAGLARVDEFDAHGNFIRAFGRNVVSSGPGDNPAASAVQRLDTTAAGAGNYKLQFGAETTVAEIEVGSGKAAELQAALRGLFAIGKGTNAANVNVAEASAGVYDITFTGDLASSPQPAIVPVAGAPAASPLPIVSINTTGSNEAEICTAAAICRTGVVGGGSAGAVSQRAPASPAIVPSGGSAGNVLVADSDGKRVSEFTATGQFVRAFGWDVVAAGPSNTVSNQFEVCRASEFDACKTGAEGGGTGQFPASAAANTALAGIAVASDGRIYTSEGAFMGSLTSGLGTGPGANWRVQRFAPSGADLVPTILNPSIGGSEMLSGSSAANSPGPISIDPVNDHLYVVRNFPAGFPGGPGNPPAVSVERRVLEIDLGTDALVEARLAGAASGLTINGLAVRPGGTRAYLTSREPTPGVHLFGDVLPPTVTIEATTPVGTDSAVLHGTVEPNEGSIETGYHFEYKRASDPDVSASWTNVPSIDVNLGTGEGAGSPTSCPAGNPPLCEVSQEITGLEPNRAYNVKLVATKAGVPTVSVGSAGDFTTDPAPPAALTFPAYWDASAAELVLRGGVNPNNSPTTYHFAYGTDNCTTGAATPEEPVGAGGSLSVFDARVAGLEPGATYRYCIVADGFEAPVQGVEREITIPADGVCSNEQLRVQNGSTSLPECRAFEWVSNGDSWGGGVVRLVGVSMDGEHVRIAAGTGFNNPDSTPGVSPPATAVREGDRWSVQVALPPGLRTSGGGILPVQWFSSDLTAVLWSGNTQGEGYRGQVQWLIEGIDGSSTPAAPPLLPLNRTGPPPGLDYAWSVSGASADLSAFIFAPKRTGANVGEVFFPDEPMLTGPWTALNPNANLYAVRGAGGPSPWVEMVNRQDDPAPGVLGAQLGGSCGASGEAISENGEVAYFSARPTASLGVSCPLADPMRVYKRVGGTETKAIGNPLTPGGSDVFQGASDDGTVVVLRSPRQLVGSDADATDDIYIYDEDPPGTGQPHLVQVSAGEMVPGDHPTPGAGAEALAVVGFRVDGNLPGGSPGPSRDGSRVYFTAKGRLVADAVAGKTNLYVYERSEEDTDGRLGLVATLNSGGGSFVLGPEEPGSDGRFLLFTTATKALPEDGDSSVDLYRYDDEEKELTCISCLGSGAFDVSIGTSSNEPGTPASDDGETVAFTTREGLVDEDLNGASDVYIWRDGALALASAGSGQFGASSSLLSPDGKSVFFMTQAPLYAADTNNAVDVYAARIEGGFPPPPPKAICASGDECQGAAGAAPAPGTQSSSGFEGTGNVKATPPARCNRNQVRRGNRCVAKRRVAQQRCGKRRGKAKRRCVNNQVRRLNRIERAQGKRRAANTDRGGNR